MKDIFALIVVLLAVCVPAGCRQSAGPSRRSDIQARLRDYDETWQAVCTVMANHFRIARADRDAGIVEAAPIRNDGKMAHGETVVKAAILPRKGDGYAVEVRATERIEVSEPVALRNETPRYQWVPVGFNKRLEAELLNEIDELRFSGTRARHVNKFLEIPAEEEKPAVQEK